MFNVGWNHILIFILLFYGVRAVSQVKQGFNDKFMSTRQQLTNTIYQDSGDQNNLKINMSTLWSAPIGFQLKRNIVPSIIRTNKHTIMLDNLELWVFKEEKFQFKTTLTSFHDSDVHFVKGFEWQNRLFLLVCFQNSVCGLYSSSYEFHVTYHQSISGNGDPTDAHFFVQQGKLFLTILFREHSTSVRLNRTSSRLRIYQWQNLYMDQELIPDITPTATCIALFKHDEDIVPVLGCPGEESLKFPSQVWSRKLNGEMTFVQYLPTDRPTSINHFTERGENFILILEKDREPTVYWWEGSEFVHWLSVEGMEKNLQATVSSYLRHTTFLTFTHESVLKICLMTSVKLEEIYETEFSSSEANKVISILSVLVFEENDKSYMLAITKTEGQLYISLHQINVHIMVTAAELAVSEEHRSDTVQEVLETISRGIISLEYKMKNLETLSSSVLLTNKDFSISHGVVTEEVSINGGEIYEMIHLRQDIAQFISDLYTNYVEPISQEINSTWKKLNSTLIHEPRSIIFQGNVIIREAKMNALSAQLVNNNIFEPRSLLAVTSPTPQRLKHIKAQKLSVDWLLVQKIGNKEVEDLRLTDSTVRVPIRIASLESRNLEIREGNTINNIPVMDLAMKHVTVEEYDTFNRISQIGGKGIETPKMLQLQDNTVIQNLIVDFIDGIHINQALTSVFVNGVHNEISGDVHFEAGVRAKEVIAHRFHFPERQSEYPQQKAPSQSNGYPHQIIIPVAPPSRINILPPHLNILPLPVNMHPQFRPQIPVYLPYPPRVSPIAQYWTPFNPIIRDGRRMKREYEDDESIIRKVKVKIIGNLKVARLLFRNSSMEVRNQPVPTVNLRKTFWTRKSPQEITQSVHFTQGITIENNLESPFVNGQDLREYASTTSKFGSLHFENIFVDGNITTEEDAFAKNPEIKTEEKEFKVLNVKHLNVKSINGLPIENLLQTKNLHGEGLNVITGALKVGGDLEVDYINDKNVKQKLNSALTTDSDMKLNVVEFKNISANNMMVKNLSDSSMEYFKRLTSRENSTVFIHGNIHLASLSKVMSINNQSANLSKVVNKKTGGVIYGRKKFMGQVIVSRDLKIKSVNNISFDDRLKNLLRVSEEQNVTGFYTFRTVEMKSDLIVSLINGARVSDFMLTNQPSLTLLGNVTFRSISVDGNITSASLHRDCQLPQVEEDGVVFERGSKWSSVGIGGDSHWPEIRGGKIQHLFESAVTSTSDQVITGNVTIKLLSIPKVQAGLLNGKNISFVFLDTLSRRKENQVISGKKTFFKGLKCKNIVVKWDAQIPVINDVNINNINEKLVRHNGDGKEVVVVTGHKTFVNGFKAFSLECPEGINGVKAENIVSRKFTGEAPPFTVQSLKVFGPLSVEKVNNLNLKEFVEDCIYLNHTETQRILGRLHIKGNLLLQGNVTTPSINNISTSDIVYVTNKKKSRITGCKRFTSDVTIESDSKINILNNRNFTKTYNDSVKIDQDVTINGSVIFESPVEIDTIYAKGYFVGPKQLIHLDKTFVP